MLTSYLNEPSISQYQFNMLEISNTRGVFTYVRIWKLGESASFRAYWTESADPENSADLRLQEDTSAVRTSPIFGQS